MSTAEKQSEVAASQPRRSVWRNVVLAAVIVAATAAVVGGLVYLQDRSLVEAEQRLQEGKPDAALKLIETFLEQHPEDQRGLALKARAMVALGNAEEAIPLFRRAGLASPTDMHAFARALLSRQQWSEALAVLDRLLEIDDSDADALYEATVCCSHLGRYKEAIERAERLTELPGYEARGLVLLGTLHNTVGNKHRAAEAWQQVLQLSPQAEDLQVRPDEFLLAYGGLLADAGRASDALPLLERSRALRPTAEVHVRLGNVRLQLNEPQQAQAEWLAAVKLDTLNLEAREALASDSLRRGEPDEALQWLLPVAMKGRVKSSTAYLVQRAHTALGNDQIVEIWRKKADSLRQAEKLNAVMDHILVESPDSYWAQIVRAYRFAQEENWSQAAAMLQPALADDNTDPFVQKLADAIQRRGPLPPVEDLPIKLN